MTSETNRQLADMSGHSPEDRPAIDHRKVARLRRELVAGTYALDPEAIAVALLAADAVGVR